MVCTERNYEISQEERQAIFTLHIEKATEMLAPLDLLVKNEYWGTIANRLYFALYHAVNALLISEEHNAYERQDVEILFFIHFIKTGLFDEDDSKLYTQLHELRERADYNCAYEIGEEEIVPKIAPTKELIEKIKQYIESKQ